MIGLASWTKLFKATSFLGDFHRLGFELLQVTLTFLGELLISPKAYQVDFLFGLSWVVYLEHPGLLEKIGHTPTMASA